MDAQHWAKFIQIFGLLVGTGFGSILFNPDVVGRFAHRLNNRFLVLTGRLNRTIYEVPSVFNPPSASQPTFKTIFKKRMLFSTLTLSTIWILFIFSIVKYNPYLLGICSFILFFRFLILAIMDVIIRRYSSEPARYQVFLDILHIFRRIISGFTVFPFFVILFFISHLLVFLIVYFLNSISGKNIIRRSFIISGFIFILIGLIMEFFFLK